MPEARRSRHFLDLRDAILQVLLFPVATFDLMHAHILHAFPLSYFLDLRDAILQVATSTIKLFTELVLQY
jgi:hypothetical protein